MSAEQILIVEDEALVARCLQGELESLGYEVPAIASSCAEAVAQAEATHPDLVLMDIVLKGPQDGIEAARQIRGRFDIPVVYLSAFGDESTLQRAAVTEPHGYLLKPYEERELRTTIETALHRHRFEHQLKENRRWLAAALRNIGDSVIITDTGYRVRSMNLGAEALTGWREEDAAGIDLTMVLQFRDERRGTNIDEWLSRSVQERAAVDFGEHAVLVAKGGSELPVEGNVSPIYADDGAFAGVVLAFRDVSERRKWEALRRQNELRDRQAQKLDAVTRLAAGVASDFNNLLTVILGNTSLVLENLSAFDPYRQLLIGVDTAARRASQLVDRLFVFSGHGGLCFQAIDFNRLVQESLVPMRRVLGSKISLEFRPHAAQGTVQADEALVKEVLMLLGMYARVALREGGQVLLETENVTLNEVAVETAQEGHAAGEYVLLRITSGPVDSAQGQQPVMAALPDGQSDVSLELAVVDEIVEQHRGTFELHREADGWTRFDLFLPRYGQPFPAASAATTEQAPHPAGVRTVLLADDEPLIRDLGRRILEGCGYRVVLAEDGARALEIYRRDFREIDLVILGLIMPRLSGNAAFEEMLSINPQARVLFSSSYFTANSAATDDRVLGVIGKPFGKSELADIVRQVLEC